MHGHALHGCSLAIMKGGSRWPLAHDLIIMEGTQEQKEDRNMKSKQKHSAPSLEIVQLAKRVETLEDQIEQMESELKSTITCRYG